MFLSRMRWKLRNPKRGKQMLLAVALAGVIIAGVSLAENHKKETASLEIAGGTFLRFGLPVNMKEDPKYIEALHKFPNFESCLLTKQGGLDFRETRILWGKIHELEELDVCLFWAADRVRNINSLKAWMENNGYGSFVQFEKPASQMGVYNAVGKGGYINGDITREKIQARFGWLKMLGVYGMSSSIVLDGDNRPLNVHSGLSRK